MLAHTVSIHLSIHACMVFESWVSEALASSIGRFVDIQSLESLKISLWAGQCVLQDVRLRKDAFDYLKLPLSIHSGSIGRLCIKVIPPSPSHAMHPPCSPSHHSAHSLPDAYIYI